MWGSSRGARCRVQRYKAIGFFALTVLAAAAIPPARGEDAHVGADNSYALLSLNGQHVKWGEPKFGEPARLTYAFLKSPQLRPRGINCRAMAPFPRALGPRRVAREAVEDGFRAAFDIWRAAAAVTFQETEDAATADVVIGVQAVPRGIAFADVEPIARPGAGVASIGKAAVCFNPEKVWKSGFDGDLRSYDVTYVALHEIGHVLGLDHVWTRAGTVMAAAYTERQSLPQAGDLAGARRLYGDPNVVTARRRP